MQWRSGLTQVAHCLDVPAWLEGQAFLVEVAIYFYAKAFRRKWLREWVIPAYQCAEQFQRFLASEFRRPGRATNAIEVVMEIVVILQSNVASRIGIRFGLIAILIRGTTKVSAARRKGKTIMQRRHSE